MPAPAPAAKKEEPKKPAEPKPARAPVKKEEAKKAEEPKKAEQPKPTPAPAPAAKKEEPKKPAEPKPAPTPVKKEEEKKPDVKPKHESEKVEIRPATPVDSKQRPAIQIRPAELNSKTSKALGEKEQKILASIKKLSPEQVRELAEVYSRLGNRVMTGILTAELQRRDPNDAAVQELLKSQAEAALLPDDSEATRAEELLVKGNAAEAAGILKKLKAEKYAGKPFRYQQDLAYALLESGQNQEAEAAFRELLGSSVASGEEKADAGRSLTRMAFDALAQKGESALTAKDARRAMNVADQLLEKNPDDPDGVALKAAALSLMGTPKKAVDYLMDLKSKAPGPYFRHQKALADTFYDAKDFDSAQEAYESIVFNKQYSTEDRTDAKMRLKDLVRDRLILAGEAALKHRDFAGAERVAVQLEAERPVHPDARAFRAQILAKQRRFGEALLILEDVRRTSKEPFTANSDLAEAYMNTGRWQDAAETFTLAENDPREDDVTRFEAARLGREMRSRYRPTVSSVYEAEKGEEGSLWRHTGEATTGIIGNGNQFILRTWSDQVNLDDASRVIQRSNSDRWQAELAYRRLISHGFFGEVSVGGSDDDVVYGAKFGRYEGPGLAWDLSWRGNDRATDSMQLEALNGRQNTLALYIGSHFSRRFYLDARFYFRQVNVSGHDLGDGWGLDMNVGYTLLEETQRRPELQISYFNEISFFNSKKLPDNFVERVTRKGFAGSLEEALIDENINRHGVILTLSKQLNHRVNAYIYGGVSYEFEHGELEGRAGAGIEAYLNKNTSLNIGVDYTTSGNAGNRGSDVLTGTVGVRINF